MKEKCDFLGACHSPNSIRGLEVTDRKQIWIDDTNYNYSLDSNDDEIKAHAHKMHYGAELAPKTVKKSKIKVGKKSKK